MGKEMKRRNENIIAMRKAGITYSEIAREYGLSIERIIQIFNKQKTDDNKRKDPLYGPILKSCEKLGYGSEMATRTYNALNRSGFHEVNKIIEAYKDGYDFNYIRNIGMKSIEVIDDVIASAK